MLNLTIEQIYNLASFAGLLCGKPSDEESDTEIYIDEGVIQGDDGSIIHQGLRAHFTEYPEEGYIPLD